MLSLTFENFKLKTVICMFSVSFTNWVLKTIFVFYPFWVAKQVFSLKNRKLFLKIENKGKKQLPNIPLHSDLIKENKNSKNTLKDELYIFYNRLLGPVDIGVLMYRPLAWKIAIHSSYEWAYF